MKILIDTREQLPLIFDNKNIEGVEFMKLEVGDYGCRFKDGSTPSIFFERKSISDLCSTLTSGYKRFKREIIRSQEQNLQLFLIIEGSLSKVLKGSRHSSVNPISIIYTMFTLWVKHGVQPIFCKDRVEMAIFIAEFYCAIGREGLRKQKEENRGRKNMSDTKQ